MLPAHRNASRLTAQVLFQALAPLAALAVLVLLILSAILMAL